MDLKHMRWFGAGAEESSFTKAGLKLHVPQPPLSRQIKLLEQELGVTLLRRTTQKVSLTRAGATFLEHARITLTAAEQASVATKRAAEGRMGNLRIGYIGAAAYSFLPAVLRAVRKERPPINLTLRIMTIPGQGEAFRGRPLGAGFWRE